MDASTKTIGCVTPWNKGKLLGQKPPLKLGVDQFTPMGLQSRKGPALIAAWHVRTQRGCVSGPTH